MASDFDRDNSIDQLLKGARRNPGTGEAGPDCLDAETLADWADGGLDDTRVRAIEAHVADCARCQTMSAVFYSAGDAAVPAGGNVVPFRRNRLMYWLPIAAGTAAAASLVIWLGVREGSMPEPAATIASADESLRREGNAPAPLPAEPAATPPPSPAKQIEAKAAPRADRARAAELRPETAAKGNQAGSAVKPSPAPIAQPTGAVTAPPPPTPAYVPPPAPPAIAPPPAQVGAAAGVARQSITVTAASETVFRSKEEVKVIAEFSSADARSSTISGLPANRSVAGGAGRGGGGGGRGGAARGAAVMADVSGLLATTYWRIQSSDVVEKSTDRVTWTAVAITPPVQGLAAGSAPAPNVCWLAGKAGLVLLMTDGSTFTRVAAPSTADISAISAINALQASVRTVDGVTFTTTDGGKTWK